MRPTIYSPGWWRPKPRPLLTSGRVFHAAIAFCIVMATSEAWGYPGLAVGSLGAVALGWIWEALTPLRRWPHPWGDVLDFCAFEVGQIAGVALWYASRGGVG